MWRGTRRISVPPRTTNILLRTLILSYSANRRVSPIQWRTDVTRLFKTYFGAITDGTLGRLQYLGYFLFAGLIVIALGIGIGLVLGVAEHLVGGNIAEAQAILRARFSTPFIFALLLFPVTFVYALLNISAKRIRNIGLPAWWAIFSIVVVSGMNALVIWKSSRHRFTSAYRFPPGGSSRLRWVRSFPAAPTS